MLHLALCACRHEEVFGQVSTHTPIRTATSSLDSACLACLVEGVPSQVSIGSRLELLLTTPSLVSSIKE